MLLTPPPNQVKDFSLRQIRELTDRSFFWFVKIMGGAKTGRDISPDFYPELCAFSQDPTIPRKAIAMPRYWMKSTVFTRWKAIWSYLQNQNTRQLIVSETERLASSFLLWIEKAMLGHRLLRAIYPDKLHKIDKMWKANNRWSGSACDLPHGEDFSDPSISAIGIGGAAQGGHYDVIRIDDLIGESSMNSIVVLQDASEWFDNVEELLAEPDVTKPNPSSIEIVGTHWRMGDIFCYIQEKYPAYQWRIVPCRKDIDLKSGYTIDGTYIKWVQNTKVEAGESNWPEYKSTEHYKKMEANPQELNKYRAQHMNNPSLGLTKFNKTWIKFFHYEDREESGIKTRYIVCNDDDKAFRDSEIDKYGVIDPGGFSEVETRRSSNNAIVIGGQAKDSVRKFVTYAWAGKPQDPDDFRNEVFKAYDDQHPKVVRIETFGAQNFIWRDLMLEKKKRGSQMSIVPLPKDVTKGIKDDEALALIPPIQNGEIYFHNTQKGLIGELINFPGLTRDLVDALGKLARYYWTRTKKETITRYVEAIGADDGRSLITGY